MRAAELRVAPALVRADNTVRATREGEIGGGPSPRHFLDIDQISKDEVRGILDHSSRMKMQRLINPGLGPLPLAGRTLAMIFSKPSTRTRVSFEVGMQQLGGHVIVLDPAQMQLGRGETIADTARVLSRYIDAIMLRTNQEASLLELAQHATVPVINGLTDQSHPCQILADLMTFEEHRGSIAGRTISWVGDGNNVLTSWIHAAAYFDFELRIATPDGRGPNPEVVAREKAAGARITECDKPQDAVAGSDCVVTDTWLSMHDQESGTETSMALHNQFAPYQVNDQLMALANPDALFMHCLPAHRGEEVTESVIDGPQSVVLDEAENRLHAQKGILAWCMGSLSPDEERA